MVTDMFGSKIMRTHTENPAPSTGRMPRNERMRAGSLAK